MEATQDTEGANPVPAESEWLFWAFVSLSICRVGFDKIKERKVCISPRGRGRALRKAHQSALFSSIQEKTYHTSERGAMSDLVATSPPEQNSFDALLYGME